MKSKEIRFSKEARQKIKEGVDTLHNAVSVTLGPKGRNVVIDQDYSYPKITKDGVTVARETDVSDKGQNMGVQLMKEASIKTMENAGDGTTTAVVLAHDIISKGMDAVERGANPIELKKGMDKALEIVLQDLYEMSEDVSDDKLLHVATVSSNGDETMAKQVVEAIQKVGRDGVVTLAESPTPETYVDLIPGMQIDDRGYIDVNLINERNTCVLPKGGVKGELCFILITDLDLVHVQPLMPLMEALLHGNQQLLLIGNSIEGEVLSLLVLNKMRGTFNSCGIESPSYGTERVNLLKDIAVLTGGRVLSKEYGDDLTKMTREEMLQALGRAQKVTVHSNKTIITGGVGDMEKIQARCDEIKGLINATNKAYEKELLRKRLAKLKGGVGVIYVGGNSEPEMKERKDRFDDTLQATRCAIQEGIVPGGGVVQLRLSQALKNNPVWKNKMDNNDQQEGAVILMEALMAPFRKILSNGGHDTSEIETRVLQNSGAFGFDSRKEQYGDLKEMGVIDPTKVTRVSLQSAVSIASTLLTTECSMTVIPEDKNNG